MSSNYCSSNKHRGYPLSSRRPVNFNVARRRGLHYLSEGLLPEPVKTRPNMAYYDAQCIDRIKFIRYLQHKHRLSLSEIKQMMDSRGDGTEFSLRLELNELIFGQSEPGLYY